MKPFYVVLLMGAAALGGGLVVRYSDHPVQITLAHSIPPTVIAPPIPPSARVGPSTSVPVHAAPPETRPDTPDQPDRSVARAVPEKKPEKPQKPSALSPPAESRIVARVKIPPEPPAVTQIERTTVVVPPKPIPIPQEMASTLAPRSAPTQALAQAAPPASPPPPESNHATLKAGMVISVRITQALSSNLNSQGDVFSGMLDRPLIADGFVIAERGARVRGEVIASTSTQPGQGVPELSVRLREIAASDGQRVHIVSEPWRKPGIPTAAAPARPNTVYDSALTRGGAAVIRPGTSIPFRLEETVELTEKH